jgi:hypothetical protein
MKTDGRKGLMELQDEYAKKFKDNATATTGITKAYSTDRVDLEDEDLLIASTAATGKIPNNYKKMSEHKSRNTFPKRANSTSTVFHKTEDIRKR